MDVFNFLSMPKFNSECSDFVLVKEPIQLMIIHFLFLILLHDVRSSFHIYVAAHLCDVWHKFGSQMSNRRWNMCQSKYGEWISMVGSRIDWLCVEIVYARIFRLEHYLGQPKFNWPYVRNLRYNSIPARDIALCEWLTSMCCNQVNIHFAFGYQNHNRSICAYN